MNLRIRSTYFSLTYTLSYLRVRRAHHVLGMDGVEPRETLKGIRSWEMMETEKSCDT
jgi:hypothetical protein